MTPSLLRRGLVAFGGAFAASSLSRAQGGDTMTRIDFETATASALPPGITGALTGSGAPAAWVLLADATAPAGPHGRAQTSAASTGYRSLLATVDAHPAENVHDRGLSTPVVGDLDPT